MENKAKSHTRIIILRSGFTLIEISVVLVIIGLLVGGILTGRDLMDTAAQRAQISQIEKYNVAVNTFRGKYGYLPGDIPDPTASQFGFIARGTHQGQGDGNGIIEGYNGTPYGLLQEGETLVFWVDLSTAGLIDGTFNTAVSTSLNNGYTYISLNTAIPLSSYVPLAKIGQANYLTILSIYGTHYFAMSNFGNGGSIASNGGMSSNTTSALTVMQAYNIDTKIDDGLPQTGSVQAILGGFWWAGDFSSYYGGNGIPGTNTSWWPASSASCFDNGGVGGNTQKYSIAYQNGANINCALTFKFQ